MRRLIEGEPPSGDVESVSEGERIGVSGRKASGRAAGAARTPAELARARGGDGGVPGLADVDGGGERERLAVDEDGSAVVRRLKRALGA